MAQISVKLRSGETVPMNYPDDWSTEQVEKAIHESFPDEGSEESSLAKTPFNDREPEPLKMKERTGFKAIGSDVAHMLSKALKGGIGFVKDIPEEYPKSKKLVQEHPLRAIGDVLASAAELGKGVINAPHDLNRYLSKRDVLPEVAKKYGDWIPHIPEDTGLEKLMGLDKEQEGDRLFRAIPEVASLAAGAGSIISKGAKLLTSPSKESLLQRALKETVDKAKEAHNLSKADVTALENSLTEQFSGEFGKRIGKTTPVGQKESINVKQAKVKALEPETKIPEQEVKELPAEPDVKEAEKRLSEALEATRNHSKHGGRIYKQAIEADKAAASDLYDNYRATLRKNNIKVDNSAEIKDVTQKLNDMKDSDELAPGYGIGTEEQKALESQLDKLKSETVNAEDVFAVKRTLDKMADDTRAKQFSGVSDIEFKQLKSVAERLEDKADKLGKVLENVGGSEATKMLKEANKGWSNYAAARIHPIGRKVLKEGLLPANTIAKLESTQRGTDYLNAIKEGSPQLQKHILSQTYGKPSQYKHLLETKEEVEPYLANREDLHPHIENLRETKHASEEHKRLTDSMKKVAEEQMKRHKAIQETNSLKKEIKFHEEAIPKLEVKIKAAEAKGQEHAKLDRELKEHQQHVKEKNHRLKKLINVGLKTLGISSLGHKFGL